MKHSMSIMMATIMMVIFGGSTYAQTPDWLDGKWLAAGEIYVIEGNQIEKIIGEGTVQLGEFVLAEDNSLWVDGRPLGLIASPEKQALVYETNPGRAFPKYEDLSLGSKYSWVAGSWTDGSDVLTFTEKEVSFKKSGNVVDKGIFFIDENGLIDVYWENDSFSEGLMACGDAIAYQGGDRLVKIPEHADEGAEGTDLIASLTESSTPYEGDVKWVYGRWTMPDSREEIYITPKYYQARGANDSYLAGKEITELEKVEYTVMEEKNQVRGDVIRLGDYYLDTTEKLLYSFTGIDGRNYLEQTEKYVSPVIRYGKWVLLGLAGIAAIVFLVILLIRLIKKMVASFKKWRQKTKAKLVIKTQVAKEKAKALGEKAKELSGQAQVSAKNLAQNIEEASSGSGIDLGQIKKWGAIALVVIAILSIPRWCADSDESSYSGGVKTENVSHSSKKFVGMWTTSGGGWAFDLKADGSAHVKMGPFEWNAQWTKEKEDDYAVIGGAYEVYAILLYPNGSAQVVQKSGEIRDVEFKFKKR